MSSSLLDIAHDAGFCEATWVLAGPAVRGEVEGALVAIVDDEALVRRSLERLVRSVGYRGMASLQRRTFWSSAIAKIRIA